MSRRASANEATADFGHTCFPLPRGAFLSSLAKDVAASTIHPATEKTRSRPHAWKVVHACELAREVLPLVQGQLAAGMRPYLLTPTGYGSARKFLQAHDEERDLPVSLLDTWKHVRHWRRLLTESAAETSAEIIHTHSFAAGMAAVRASNSVVYSLNETVEQLAIASGNCNENSWLARSFRVAEHFVLTRAAAVVVHRESERQSCIERGVDPSNAFVIPEPIDAETLASTPDRKWIASLTGADADSVIFLVPDIANSSSWERRDAVRQWMRVVSLVRHKVTNVRFVFMGNWEVSDDIHQIAFACNLMPVIKVLAPDERERAISSADVVICDSDAKTGDRPVAALESLARGRALLAMDIPEHRAITADGRGCLWFRANDIGDLLHRAVFLATNAQFRRALAAAGHEYMVETRSPEVIGAQYDSVYRLAFSKRKGRDSSTPRAQLIPLQAGS
jgi:glycosyltransferase involved in cell wall biosynthesis